MNLLANLITILFWGGIIAIIIYAIKSITFKNPITKTTNEKTPIELLKVRLAKGEITEAEFERIKNHLQS